MREVLEYMAAGAGVVSAVCAVARYWSPSRRRNRRGENVQVPDLTERWDRDLGVLLLLHRLPQGAAVHVQHPDGFRLALRRTAPRRVRPEEQPAETNGK